MIWYIDCEKVGLEKKKRLHLFFVVSVFCLLFIFLLPSHYGGNILIVALLLGVSIFFFYRMFEPIVEVITFYSDEQKAVRYLIEEYGLTVDVVFSDLLELNEQIISHFSKVFIFVLIVGAISFLVLRPSILYLVVVMSIILALAYIFSINAFSNTLVRVSTELRKYRNKRELR